MLFWLSQASAESERIAYIFSGYKSTPSKSLYQDIGNVYRKQGITPIYVEIDWRKNSIENYVSQAKKFISLHPAHKKYFYGFSLGGLIALSMASEFGAEKVVVSSVAPFFNEDIDQLPFYSLHKLYNWWLFRNNKSISLNKIISNLNNSATIVTLLVGSEEEASVIKCSKFITENLVNSDYIVMKNIGHGLSQTGHIQYIESVVSK